MAEYATAKIYLPKSKKPLEYKSTGEFDKDEWQEAGKQLGPAARPGDLVQVTKVDIDDNKIVLEINGGAKGKRKWYQNVEVGMGQRRTTPINSQQNTAAPGGTTIALVFDKEVPALHAAELKKLLAPILDFEKRTRNRAGGRIAATGNPGGREGEARHRRNGSRSGHPRDREAANEGSGDQGRRRRRRLDLRPAARQSDVCDLRERQGLTREGNVRGPRRLYGSSAEAPALSA